MKTSILGIRKDNIKTTSIISPFWYKRICEVTLLVSAIIVGVYGFGYLMSQDGQKSLPSDFLIPMHAAIMAAIAVIISTAAYLRPPRQATYWAALASYALLFGAIASVVVLTGATSSPFIALWMLMAVFSGLFGMVGIGSAGSLFIGYVIYLYASSQAPSGYELTVLGIAGGLPVAISFMIWHGKSSAESRQDKAFSAMAEELSNVANKSEIVINAIADGVIAVDNKGIVRLINPAAQSIIGWGKEDSLNLDYKLILKLADDKGNELTDAIDPVKQVLLTGNTVVNDDLMIITNSGKQLLVSVLVSPVGDKGAGAIIVFRDITTQKMEERSQAEFISTASHEMRTPVAAIEGYLGLSLNPATATIDDKARMYLLKAHESAQHLGHLFQDLLDVSKAEDGRLNSNPVVIDVVEMISDLTGSFETQAREKGLFLVCKAAPAGGGGEKHISPVYYALADRDHVREVISNLIENALKYTKEGTVTVDVSGDQTTVTISVKDSGIGIPPEDVSHLFQKFYRVDSTDTREIGGTGLGLYLCRRLVETMNGRIWVESEYGKGSTFLVALPRLSNEEALSRIKQTNEAAAAAQAAAANSQPANMTDNYISPSALQQSAADTSSVDSEINQT